MSALFGLMSNEGRQKESKPPKKRFFNHARGFTFIDWDTLIKKKKIKKYKVEQKISQ